MELLLLVAVGLAAVVGAYAFWVGDQRRRRRTGVLGPRPCASVGEALERVPPRGRVAVLFLDDGEASVATAAALADDPAVVGALARDDVQHVVVRVGDDPDVATALFSKYSGGVEKLPALPAALLLDGNGQSLGTTTASKETPLPGKLPGLLG